MKNIHEYLFSLLRQRKFDEAFSGLQILYWGSDKLDGLTQLKVRFNYLNQKLSSGIQLTPEDHLELEEIHISISDLISKSNVPIREEIITEIKKQIEECKANGKEFTSNNLIFALLNAGSCSLSEIFKTFSKNFIKDLKNNISKEVLHKSNLFKEYEGFSVEDNIHIQKAKETLFFNSFQFFDESGMGSEFLKNYEEFLALSILFGISDRDRAESRMLKNQFQVNEVDIVLAIMESDSGIQKKISKLLGNRFYEIKEHLEYLIDSPIRRSNSLYGRNYYAYKGD